MQEYKCISCGKVKMASKSSCCSVCGYKMFKAPYDRRELLKEEIRNFIRHLRVTEIQDTAYTFYREESSTKQRSSQSETVQITKEKDDARFPDFDSIQHYICSVTRTEVFTERMNEAIQQISQHLHKTYSRQYKVNAAPLKQEVETWDAVLERALKVLEMNMPQMQIDIPNFFLDYREVPNEELLPIADDLLSDALQLSRKILNFIKINNVYGTAYRDIPKSQISMADATDFKAGLVRRKKKITCVLNKNYTVDLLSDGYEELAEMLSALWSVLEAVMLFPVLEKKYAYVFEDGAEVIDSELYDELLRRINSRYAPVDDLLKEPSFLSGYTEEALFNLYDQMIALDTFGFIGIERKKIIKTGESEKKLQALIGLSCIKESVQKIKAYALMNKDNAALNLHMCFLGNPGSGKTEVARHVANILYENNILPSNKFIEVDRSGLVSQYFGATAEKTSQIIKKAIGGVLFIDEAYALGNNANEVGISDYGKEAIDTLVKAMEDYRGKFCVILAGYRNEMQQMISVNPGLRSRIQFVLDFPNYTRDELKRISLFMLEKRSYSIDEIALNRILDITEIRRKDPNFANAREIRNILDQVIMCQNLRCMETGETEIGLVDVNKYIHDAKINLSAASETSIRSIASGEEELERLIGLDTVKRMIKKIKAYAKRNKDLEDFNLHMCFYGNPGTGKTEVARILSRILYDASVLDEAKLIETDALGLLGKFVGETAPKTLQKVNEAMGGVLFIDEAYALTNGTQQDGVNSSYGEEAIAVLLREMENHRGQFCTILAGYKQKMKEMLSTNPGMESRIQFTLEFPDYTREELGAIAQRFLTSKQYSISDDALIRFLDIMEYFRKQPNFANARTVRNVIDQVIMNQNLRTEDNENDSLIILEDVEDYLADEGIDIHGSRQGTRRIGFV